jgi:importin subunit beta-1
MSQSIENIEEILSNALSAEKSINQPAMIEINKLSQENFSLFLHSLGNILSNESKATNIRQLSAILIKNSLIYFENLQNEWKKTISTEDKNQIKLLILSSLASKHKEIRTSTSSVIASICKIEQPIMKNWPDLINSLVKNCFNEDLNLKLAAIETLGYVCEEINIKGIDTTTVDQILNSFIQNLINCNDINIAIQVLKSLFHTVKLAEKNFSSEKELNIIMNSIFSVVEKFQTNEEILEKTAMLFIEIIGTSNYYKYIYPFFEQIIKFAFNIVTAYETSNEKLSLFGIEIICSIGDEEAKIDNTSKISISDFISGNYKNNSNCYFNKISNQLQELIIKYVKVPDEDEDENEWNLSKGCLYILSLLVKIADLNNINNFFKQLGDQIKNCNNVNDKCKCWYLLSSALYTIYKNEMYSLISNNLNNICKDLNNNAEVKLQKSSSFLLIQITKLYPKILDSNKLNQIISLLLNCLKNSNPSIYQNIFIILQNIIKSNGDLQTNKSSNTLSNYFDDIIRGIFIPATKEAISNSENTKLALSRLITIGTLIDYSSHDKQEKIMEILLQFLQEIESTYTQFQNMISNGASQEKIFQIQDYYYTLLRIIFNKYKSQINLDLGKKIWELTDNIFKFRKTVFEEANLALASLATNMKESFYEIFKNYYPFIEFSIKSYNISSLCQSGLVALQNSIHSIKKNVENNANDIIKVLIEVCTSNDVSRGNKTIAISCLGEIAINIGLKFSDYLSSVMQLLFSACEMGVNINENEEEDTIEFIKNLRYELIMTFTCIEFSVEDKTELLNPYIQNIFIFFKSIVNDKVCMNEKILKCMLNFVVDIINIYGEEIKQVCDEVFASNLINNIRNYKDYDSELSQQEQLFKKLYHH